MLRSLLLALVRRGPLLLFLVGLLSLTFQAQATHLRAGDIQSRVDATNPRRVYFRMILYARDPATCGGCPGQDQVNIYFGDGTCAIEGIDANVLYAPDIRRYTYDFEHTYNANGRYLVSFIGENRNGGVRNMIDPASQSFYIGTSVVIDPGQGVNRSPILTRPAVDNAAVAEVFQHNPGAYDPDGDSLVFVLAPSRQAGTIGGVVSCTPAPAPVPGYRLPNSGNGVQVTFSGPPVGVAGAAPIFEMNRRTGQIVWNSPGTAGEYNFAFVVRSYRRTAFGYRLNDSVIRDMQIVVRPTTNRRPELTIPPDLCVVAGTPVSAVVTATDPDANAITLSANSGILPPATFTQSSAGPPTATGTFRWTPDCNDIGVQPKLVVFNAVDQPAGGASGVALTDLRVWAINVIGPAPQNLRVTAGSGSLRTTNLEWNSYVCRKPGAQIRIFRKEGPSGFSPGPCQTGIPASSGFVQIASLTYTGTTDITSYTDDNGGAGLDRGKEYCYRIYVEFPLPAGGKSIASNEACLNFTGRALLMRQVTVDRTASSGQITVQWTKPKSTPPFADPQQFRLSRAVGQTTTGPFTPIATIPFSTSANDTTYVDQDPTLDTQTRAYSYRVEFLSQNQVQETATAASSVRVEGTAIPSTSASSQNVIALTWTYNVPWNNTLRPITIYRKGPNASPTDPFVAIATVTGTATGGSYRDEGTATQRLQKGATYCYYVETTGTYNAQKLPSNLLNKSQQQCIAVRSIPCAPVLTLQRPNCDSLASRLFELPATPISGAVYTNNLRWTLGTTPSDCSRAIQFYNIYYAPNDRDSLRFLTQVPATQTSYAHTNLRQEAGCYAVQAVDSSGTLSARSNVECKDDCQLFLLPNIFTPNGDGKNDTFRPKIFTPIRRTHFTAFNRWGVKIYESSADPLINWPGGGSRTEGSGAPSVVEGMYFYQAEVEFADANNSKRTYKGWVQITR